MAAIEWRVETDDDDNSYWEGASPYTSDSDPDAVPDIFWRLRQRLFRNVIWWYTDSDAELGGETGDCWVSLDAAKLATQKAHDHVISCEC